MNSEPCGGGTVTCPTCYGTRQIKIVSERYITRLVNGMEYLDCIETNVVYCDAEVTNVTTSGYDLSAA